MAYVNSYQSAIASFHSAIDNEQMNNYEEAYKKYAEGISLIGITLKNDVHLLNQPHMVTMHKQMLEFAKKSIERLFIVLEKIVFSESRRTSDRDENHNQNSKSTYEKLLGSLSEIVSTTPVVSFHVPDEISGICSPLSTAKEDNKRIIKIYESRMECLMNSAAKANLQLELQRRLAENSIIAKKQYEHWEYQRKILAEECQRIAQKKFFIQQKIETGIIQNADYTKQNLYAACLQFHKEHVWAQELSCKLLENIENESYTKEILSFFLQHGSHPLACILRQLQQKALHKLSKLNVYQMSLTKHEETILVQHFKNIVQNSKEDLFLLTTIMQSLWETLNTETNQILIIDVLHHLYFPTIKPHFIQLLRIILHNQEEEIKKCMSDNSQKICSFPFALNTVISKLHQLSFIHSPSTMMIFLVEILRSLIVVHSDEKENENLQPLLIGIDDIMPKLIQLILISNMPTLSAEISFVENFMPAKQALAEEGYAVTLFQSVLAYMCNNSTVLNTAT